MPDPCGPAPTPQDMVATKCANDPQTGKENKMHAKRSLLVAATVATFATAAVFAQMGGMMNTQQSRNGTDASLSEQQTQVDQNGPMMGHGRNMKAMSEQMKKQEDTLQQALDTMKSAKGDQRIGAIENVVEVLAQQRMAMYDRMEHMQQARMNRKTKPTNNASDQGVKSTSNMMMHRSMGHGM